MSVASDVVFSTTHQIPLPGPPPMPLFGWRGDLAKFFRDPIGILTRLQRTYGSVVALSRTSSRWIAAFGPEHNQRLLSEPDVFHMDPIPIPESVNAFETAGWEI